MSTFLEIKSLLESAATSIGGTFIVSHTDESEKKSHNFPKDALMVIAETRDLSGTLTYQPSSVVDNSLTIPIRFLKDHGKHDDDNTIDTIYSECLEKASDFLQFLNSRNEGIILPVESVATSRVRNYTGNTWAGVLVNFQIITSCNR